MNQNKIKKVSEGAYFVPSYSQQTLTNNPSNYSNQYVNPQNIVYVDLSNEIEHQWDDIDIPDIVKKFISKDHR